MSDKEPKIDITQINKFAFWLDENQLSDKAALMYYALVTAANIERWRQPFRLSNIVLMRRIGTKRLATLQEARKELVDKKLILYTAAKGRSEPEYTLLELKNNYTDSVQLNDEDKNNYTDSVQLNYTDNVQLNPVNNTDNVQFTQSIPIYDKHRNNNKNNTTNTVNTKLVSSNATEKSESCVCEVLDFSPVRKVEEILSVTVNRTDAEKYIDLYEEVKQKIFVESLEVAKEKNKPFFNFVEGVAKRKMLDKQSKNSKQKKSLSDLLAEYTEETKEYTSEENIPECLKNLRI